MEKLENLGWKKSGVAKLIFANKQFFPLLGRMEERDDSGVKNFAQYILTGLKQNRCSLVIQSVRLYRKISETMTNKNLLD